MKAILACDRLGGIGYEGSMPWPKQTKDLKRFKELTMGKTIIMGRGTWESKGMPKPLPGRFNVIVSSTKEPLFDASLAELNEETREWSYNGKPNTGVGQTWDLEGYNKLYPDAWIIGGAGLVNSAWDMIDEFHLTRLRETYECDTHIDLMRLASEFELERSQLCLTHNYEIWKREQ